MYEDDGVLCEGDVKICKGSVMVCEGDGMVWAVDRTVYERNGKGCEGVLRCKDYVRRCVNERKIKNLKYIIIFK